MVQRRRAVGSAVLVVVVLVSAAAAWACTPYAFISPSPSSGPAGSRVVVSGGQFDEGIVEVRWNAGGRVLFRTPGPNFSVPITVPADAVNGTHMLVASGPSGSASMTFKVTPAGASDEEASATERSASQGTTAGASTSGAGTPSTPQAAGSTSSSGGAPAPSTSGSTGGAFPTPTSSAGSTASEATPVGANAVPDAGRHAETLATGGGLPAEPARRAADLGSASSVAAGRNSSGALSPSEATAATDSSVAPRNADPLAASAFGDAWSGFEPGMPEARGASLTEGTAAGSDEAASQVVAGLFVLGLVALLAGFAVAELRRVRVSAHSTE